jgi:multiple sugar transport system substrate-binding protein
LLTLGLQQDEPLLADGGGRGNFQSRGFKAALAFYSEIFARGLAPLAADTEIGNLYDEFARGYFSFLVTGPWNLGEFARRLPAADQGLWATAPMPGPRGPGAGIAGGSSLAVRALSPRAEAAWRLIEYLTAPHIQSQFWTLTGDLPANRAAWAAPSLAGDDRAAAFKSQLERVRPTPKIPEWERIATEMQLVAEEMVRRGLSVDAAAAEIDRRANRLLEKRRWMLARGLAKPA